MRKDLRRVLALIAPERTRYALGLFSLWVVNASATLAPVFLAVGVEITAADHRNTSPETPPLLSLLGLQTSSFSLSSSLLLFLSLHLLANAARYPMLMYVAVPSQKIVQSLRNTLVQKLLSLPRSFYDTAKSGDIMSRATSDVLAIRMMLGPGILIGIDTIFIVSMVLSVLFIMSWKLTLITLIPLPIIGYITNKLSHAEYNRHEAVQEDLSNLTEFTRERFAGIRIIQGYARAASERAHFAARSHQHMLKNLGLARVRSVFDPTLDLMLGASTILVIIFGGLDTLRGELAIGSFLSFLFLVGYLAGPMVGFGWSVSLFQRGRASLKRIDELLSEPSDITDPIAPEPPPKTTPTLRIQHLSFAFSSSSESKILKDINLSLPPGQTLGIVGPVGSGKSTLVNLLARLYNPPPNTILLDNTDILSLSLNDLRSIVVLAPQDTFLFSDSIERNILLASPQDAPSTQTSNLPTKADMLASHFASLAQLDLDIMSMPDSYKTLLGERGVNLSGGQRQRLAIARALASNPKILILDDCLSAVDAKTEEGILNNLRALFNANNAEQNRSGIIVSHRVCAVQACDQIIVLRDGQITEHGTHHQLLSLGGYYAQLAAAQSSLDASLHQNVEHEIPHLIDPQAPVSKTPSLSLQ